MNQANANHTSVNHPITNHIALRKILRHVERRGEIATTLAILSLVIMTTGLLIGSKTLSQRDASSTSARADNPPRPTVTNKTNSSSDVVVNFGTITNRSGSSAVQYVLSGDLCFNSAPPQNGRYQLQVYVDLKGTGGEDNVLIGSSAEMRISSPANSYTCDHERKRSFSIAMNQDMRDIPAGLLPDGVTKVEERNVEKVHIRFTGSSGSWDFTTPITIATLSKNGFKYHTYTPTTLNTGIPYGTQTNTPSPQSTTRPSSSVSPGLGSATRIPGTPAPGNLKLNVSTSGQMFADNFNMFSYEFFVCPPNTDCNKKTSKVFTAPSPSVSPTNIPEETFHNFPSGDYTVKFKYEYLKGQTKDSTGIKVIFGGCTNSVHRPGESFCTLNINGNKTLNITVEFPDTTKKTYTLEYMIGDSDSNSSTQSQSTNCRVTVDNTGSRNDDLRFADNNCKSSFDNNKILKLIYIDDSSLEGGITFDKKIYWEFRRCNGTRAQNQPACLTNNSVNQGTTFTEGTSSRLDRNKARQCLVDISKISSSITQAEFERIIECSDITLTPTPTSTNTPTPTRTPTPTPSTSSTSTTTPATTPPGDGESEGESYYATVAIANLSENRTKSIEITTCLGTRSCETDTTPINIPPGQSGTVDHEINIPDEEVSFTQGEASFTQEDTSMKLSCAIRFEGVNDAVPCPQEVTSDTPQNIIFKINATGTAQLTGSGLTEVDATDLSGDGCINAQDVAQLILKYGNELQISESDSADINGDLIINAVDLIYTLENMNKGDSCSYNELIDPEGPGFFYY